MFKVGKMFLEDVNDRITQDTIERLRSGSSAGIRVLNAVDLGPLSDVADCVLGISVNGVHGIDWSAAGGLKNLRYFHATGSSLDGLSFGGFKKLTALDIACRNSDLPSDIGSCRGLRFLRVEKAGWVGLGGLAKLTRLAALSIYGGSLEKLGIGRLNRSLRELYLYRTKGLLSLDGIQDFAGLRAVTISGCPQVSGFDSLGGLAQLGELSVAGASLESLRFVASCSKLYYLWLAAMVEVRDGEMAPLVAHGKLRRVSFIPKKHYSHKLKEISEQIAATRRIPMDTVNDMHDSTRKYYDVRPRQRLESEEDPE